MRLTHRRVAGRLLVAAAFFAPLLGVTACSGSAGSPSAAAPSRTTPAHDYRQIPELEQFVTDEFNAAYADPNDAKYAPGTTVKTVVCKNEAGTTTYDCFVTPSKGDGLNWPYLVAEDGGSVEHGVPKG